MLLAINVDGGQTDAGLSLAPFGSLFPSSAVLTSGALQVSAQTSPGMSVKVHGSDSDDVAIIKIPTGATYYVKNTDPNESVTILANSSGVTKTDTIVGYVDLTAGDEDNAGSPGAFKLKAVRRSGTNTGAPTDGEIDAATSNNPWIRLANVTVINGETQITGGMVADLRVRAKIGLPVSTDTVDTAAIQDAAVIPAKIADDAITADKVADGAITQAAAALALFSTTSGLKFQIKTISPPAWNGILAGAVTTDAQTFSDLSTIIFAVGFPQRGGGGSGTENILITGNDLLPTGSNVYTFRIKNLSGGQTYTGKVTYLAIGT